MIPAQITTNVIDSGREVSVVVVFADGTSWSGRLQPNSRTITADMVRSIIVDHDAARPRSQQTDIGPSDLSSPCSRKLGYQILGTPKVTADTCQPGGVGRHPGARWHGSRPQRQPRLADRAAGRRRPA